MSCDFAIRSCAALLVVSHADCGPFLKRCRFPAFSAVQLQKAPGDGPTIGWWKNHGNITIPCATLAWKKGLVKGSCSDIYKDSFDMFASRWRQVPAFAASAERFWILNGVWFWVGMNAETQLLKIRVNGPCTKRYLLNVIHFCNVKGH